MDREPRSGAVVGPAPVRSSGTASPRPGRVEQRARFLSAAAHLVETEGVGAVTMERVATAAALSKPVAYKHFSDRGDLLCALLEQCWEGLDRAVQRRLRSATTFEAHIDALVAGYFEEVVAQGRVLQVLLGEATSEPALEAARHARHRAAEGEWSAFYQQRGGLPPAVADTAAAILRSALEGATAYWLEHPATRPEDCITVCTDVMRGALDRLRRRNRPAAPPAAPAPRGSGRR